MLKRRLTKKGSLDSLVMLATARKLIRSLRNSRYRALPFDDYDDIKERYNFTTTTSYARQVTDEYRKHREVSDPEEVARLHRKALHLYNLHDAIHRHERYLYDGGWRTKRTQRDMINITAQSVGFATPLKKTHLDTYDPDNPQPLIKGSRSPNRGLAGFRYTERASVSSGGVNEDIFGAAPSGTSGSGFLGGVGLEDPAAKRAAAAEDNENSDFGSQSEKPELNAGSKQ